jgi:leucine dehydrogenase
MHARGIVWAPDYAVSAGGVVNATALELAGHPAEHAARLVAGIGDTVAEILATAKRDGIPPHHAALRLAEHRLAPAPAPSRSIMHLWRLMKGAKRYGSGTTTA